MDMSGLGFYVPHVLLVRRRPLGALSAKVAVSHKPHAPSVKGPSQYWNHIRQFT
ncbi:MAG: hypothetical protein NVSMB52_09070 [Chloroflexota bacterium]